MNYTGKRVGIWGFGTTGKSLLSFFAKQGAMIEVLDSRILSDQDQQNIQSTGASLRAPHDLIPFLQENEYIIPSPGIDLRPYHGIAQAYLSEVDLFAYHFRKPIIAITGSSGKTSIVTLLEQLLSTAGARFPAAGNIGLPMLDMLEQSVDGVILELSSFQLELTSRLAPDLAIWTNLHENHLDRHGSLADYCAAKSKILAYQRPGQQALLPLNLYQVLPTCIVTRSDCAFFSLQKPTADQCALLTPHQSLYYMQQETILHWQAGQVQTLYTTPLFATLTYAQNWLVIGSALHLLNIPLETIDQAHAYLRLPEHRLEHIATINGVQFFNDSKSTLPASTLAAVHKLMPSPLVLFLGGVSKGIDRRDLIRQLAGNVRYILCFGSEATQLSAWCTQYGITTSEHKTLEDAFDTCKKITRSGDTVLFAPAGASFDLFPNYNERGKQFKQLVLQAL